MLHAHCSLKSELPNLLMHASCVVLSTGRLQLHINALHPATAVQLPCSTFVAKKVQRFSTANAEGIICRKSEPVHTKDAAIRGWQKTFHMELDDGQAIPAQLQAVLRRSHDNARCCGRA